MTSPLGTSTIGHWTGREPKVPGMLISGHFVLGRRSLRSCQRTCGGPGHRSLEQTADFGVIHWGLGTLRFIVAVPCHWTMQCPIQNCLPNPSFVLTLILCFAPKLAYRRTVAMNACD